MLRPSSSRRSRALWAPLLVGGLLLALFACGKPKRPSGETSTVGVHFLDGLAAGKKAARNPDDLLFVYVGRHHPP